MEWRPIKTAPKDGTRIFVFVPGCWVAQRKGKRRRKTQDRMMSAYWHIAPRGLPGRGLSDFAKELIEKHGGFWTGTVLRPISGSPSHWMPLPTPPSDTDR